VFLLCAFVGIVARPDARVARALAVGFGVALLVVTPALARTLSAPFVYFRVSAYAPLLIAGIAAGTVLGRPTGARRAVGAIAGLVLLALFFDPVAPPLAPPATASAPVAVATPPGEYHSIATIGLESTSTVREYFLEFEPRYGCPGTVFWLTFLAAAVLVSAARPPGRFGRGLVLGTFAIACAWPVGQSVFAPVAGHPGDAFGRLLASVAYLGLAPAWAAAAVLALRLPPSPPAPTVS
jgi:hypothetical protein